MAGFSMALHAPILSRAELLDFVDQYDDISVEEHLEFLKDPYMRRYAPADTFEITVTKNVHLLSSPFPEDVFRGDEEEQATVARLRAAVLTKLLRPESIDLDTIYDIYRSLPGQRIQCLPARLRHQFLAALAITERRNTKSMLRYFTVIADIKDCGFALSRVEWTTAMSFAGRYVGTTTETELEAVLHLWREMEHDAGIKGNEVTFNVLFDVASKAGKFALSEMIYQEMNTRGYEFNRYHHVSLMHFFGLKMEASAVRATYKEFVDAGEIVDSVVLNCLIAGFLRSGEESAAERVYEKMKRMDRRSKIVPHRDYNTNKMITKVLIMFARIGKKHPDLRDGFQRTSLVAPDLHTYQMMINHFGVNLGDLAKVAKYLDEMKWFRVPLHGSLFLALFKGFSLHGATRKSHWSLQRLEKVWRAFLDAYDEGAEGLYISTWMGMWVLRAYLKCSLSGERTLEVYGQLSSRWELTEKDQAVMQDFLYHLLRKNGLSINGPSPTSLEHKSVAWGDL